MTKHRGYLWFSLVLSVAFTPISGLLCPCLFECLANFSLSSGYHV